MKSSERPRFTVPTDLLQDGVRPGTNIMVNGQSGRGARDVALRLLMAETEQSDGILLLSADVSGRSLLKRAATVADPLDRGRIGVVDCSGTDDEHQRFDEYSEPIDHPGDLVAIEMEISTLYETLLERGYDRVRLGVFSVSSLLAHAELQAVSRFVHMLTGRIIATDDLGVFVVDGSMQDDLTVDVIEQYCDGTIDVRDSENGGVELRIRGLETDSTSWREFPPGRQNGHHRRS